MNVVIAGGGTAGHVNPAIALAQALGTDQVSFIGTSRGVEARLVPEAGFPFNSIDVRGFDRSRPWSLITAGAVAVKAIGQARGMIRAAEADVVVGMGGYVSLPAALAARTWGVPVILHEQNAVLGLAHRVSKPFARRVAVSFPETLKEVGSKGVLTGNPVLPEIRQVAPSARPDALERFSLEAHRKTLLLFGGSLGARTLNDAGIGIAGAWSGESALQVLHVSGPSDHDRVKAGVADVGFGSLLYRVVPYVDRMSDAYAVADLAVCRGGATTVAELVAVGLPSIIVPYPFHRDRQQELHGRSLERLGMALVVVDSELSARLPDLALRLLKDQQRLKQMSSAAQVRSEVDAAEELARVVKEVK